ncbi:hypothetical protein SJAG_03692 [Schizosaccharomyces japonicus yFS275]|uniref:Ataxin-10 homolog n=1 Tax=Schizosaccharomyces japonicus (strain yFS275 / FY16936) TaxID=402676 RepID=B6K4X7_SCHJY|nr:hypothetical protein SJAG_03692 [Schizosaccharomyces japonicus yFS275]EEB08534.2 hypothetical protein SJAG_03692 [Schizosaccharomyces japonicus yFS275]
MDDSEPTSLNALLGSTVDADIRAQLALNEELWHSLLQTQQIASSSDCSHLRAKVVRNLLSAGPEAQKTAEKCGLLVWFHHVLPNPSVSEDPNDRFFWQAFANASAGTSPISRQLWQFLFETDGSTPGLIMQDRTPRVYVSDGLHSAFTVALWSLELSLEKDPQTDPIQDLCLTERGQTLLYILFCMDGVLEIGHRETALLKGFVEKIFQQGFTSKLISVSQDCGHRTLYFVLNTLNELLEDASAKSAIALAPETFQTATASFLEKGSSLRLMLSDLSTSSFSSDLSLTTFAEHVSVFLTCIKFYSLFLDVANDDLERDTFKPCIVPDHPDLISPAANASDGSLKPLVKLLVDVLGLASNLFPAKTLVATSAASAQDPVRNEFAEAAAGLKRECLRLITFLLHLHPTLQDEVRELGAIPLILQQCNIDDHNPYIREITILCIRQLLFNNVENQSLVARLQPQQPVQSTVVNEAGYEVCLNSEGKPYLQSIHADTGTAEMNETNGSASS